MSPEALQSMRGVIWGPVGASVATHMTGTLGHGMGGHEYFVRAAEARCSTVRAAERRRLASKLFADLDAAIGHVEIVAQSFALRGGDELLVADGAEVASAGRRRRGHRL